MTWHIQESAQNYIIYLAVWVAIRDKLLPEELNLPDEQVKAFRTVHLLIIVI